MAGSDALKPEISANVSMNDPRTRNNPSADQQAYPDAGRDKRSTLAYDQTHDIERGGAKSCSDGNLGGSPGTSVRSHASEADTSKDQAERPHATVHEEREAGKEGGHSTSLLTGNS